MTRTNLSFGLTLLLLVAGIGCAVLSSRNRARAGRLNRRQRDCETLSRQIELRRIRNAEAEWQLLRESDAPQTVPVPAKVRS